MPNHQNHAVFLAREDVQAALGVTGHKWQDCNKAGILFVRTVPSPSHGLPSYLLVTIQFELSGDEPQPLFHFGMTGAFVVEGVAPLKYQEFKVDTAVFPPKFCKLELQFSNGARLAFAASENVAQCSREGILSTAAHVHYPMQLPQVFFAL